MARYRTEDIRNIALVGHGGAGKTTLVERMLQHTGVLKAPGSVERGTTVSDFDPLEKAHGHSLHSKVIGFDYRSTRINLIDTPGYPDFLGRALAVLPAVETVAVVVNAQTGVQMVTGRMMEWAKARDLDRLVIVNHIDADNVDLKTTASSRSGRSSGPNACRSICRPMAEGRWWIASSRPTDAPRISPPSHRPTPS